METHNITEPYLNERISHARDTARQIISGKFSTQQELENMMKWNICKHYNLPLNDPFFKTLTFDDLMLEWFLITEQVTPDAKDVAKEIANEHADELKQMGDEAVGAAKPGDDQQWVPLSPEEMEVMKQFMQTGKFKGET